MDLQQYVAEALVAVSKGIRQAQSDVEVGHLVGRAPMTLPSDGALKFDGQNHVISILEFDVATTVEKKGEGKAEINVAGLNIGGGGGVNASVISRVKFVVPFGMPAPPDQVEHARRKSDATNRAIEQANARSGDAWLP